MKFNLSIVSELSQLTEKLMLGLSKLNFTDNIEGMIVENVEIQADSTAQFENKLTFIPNRYIILSQEGPGLVTKTGTWSRNVLYLKNNQVQVWDGTAYVDSGPVKVTVFFTR